MAVDAWLPGPHRAVPVGARHNPHLRLGSSALAQSACSINIYAGTRKEQGSQKEKQLWDPRSALRLNGLGSNSVEK